MVAFIRVECIKQVSQVANDSYRIKKVFENQH
jgi:hypothetical protein